MCLCSSNIRLKGRCQPWSIISKASPRVLRQQHPDIVLGITKACCGRRVILRPRMEEYHCLSFVSILKSAEKPVSALRSTSYIPALKTGFYDLFDKSV
jgi:hypothetical protein